MRARLAILAAVVAAAPWALARQPGGPSPSLSKFTEPLPIPPTIDLTDGGALTLVEANGTNRFHASLPETPTWGYLVQGRAPTPGATYLGPTIETRRGHPIDLTITNQLFGHPLASVIDTTLDGATGLDRTQPRTATHLHGGHSPPDADGLPVDDYRPEGVDPADFASGTGSHTYRYPMDQEATTLWYHDHAFGITRLNVMAGLAGFFLVRDAYDTGRPGNPLGLPSGKYEVPLVLQDRSFNADGSFLYPLGPFAGLNLPDRPAQWLPEFFGDVATVNGKAWPNLDVDRGLYRIRLLNGSNARFYDLQLKAANGREPKLYRIGTDGGLLDAPVPITRLRLAPGERADLLLDFRALPAGTRVVLTNDARAPFPSGPRSARRGGMPLPELMQFTVGSAAGFAGPVPDTLRGQPGQPPPLPSLVATNRRTVALNEITDPQLDEPMVVLLNNLHFDVGGTPRSDAIEQPKLNSVEEWTIVNTTADAHPIHLHGVQFLVLDRQKIDVDAYLAAWAPELPDPAVSGTGPWPVVDPTPFLRGEPRRATELGWKDTVQSLPGEVTRILIPFGGTAAGLDAPYTGEAAGGTRFSGTYVWHCHILEHEDNEMMLPYTIVP